MFEPISELLPAAMDKISKRAENPLWWSIPDDEDGQIKWVNDNF